MSLAALLTQLELSQRDVARATGLSQATVCRIARGQWPARGAARARQQIRNYLAAQGASEAQLRALHAPAPQEVGPGELQLAEADPPVTQEAVTEPQGEEPMVMQHQELTEEAIEHFGLKRNPFVDDVLSDEDVFESDNIRRVRAALHDCAMNQRFMMLVGESGAGKTTLVEDLQERLKRATPEVVVIRPHVLALEENDTKGKTLKSGHIASAIARGIDDQATLPSDQDARFTKVLKMLRQSMEAGRKHLLLIEEAHCLPLPTLKHLKRWAEQKDGRQRLLGILLVGQSELRERMAVKNREVREVGARCEIKELHAMVQPADVRAYLELKISHAGGDPATVFAPDAWAALLQRLQVSYQVREGRETVTRTKSICYPLVLNNLVSLAMSEAARIHYPVLDASVIGRC